MMTSITIRQGLLIGAAAGLANGLFGAGGGVLAVPLLIRFAKLPPRTAFATSLALMLPLSAVSLICKLWQTGAPSPDAAPYVLGGIIGGVIAGQLFHRIPMVWLHRLFGALIIYGGIRAVMGW